MNKFCFGAIYNGRLWEKELRVSAHVSKAIGFLFYTGSSIDVVTTDNTFGSISLCQASILRSSLDGPCLKTLTMYLLTRFIHL